MLLSPSIIPWVSHCPNILLLISSYSLPPHPNSFFFISFPPSHLPAILYLFCDFSTSLCSLLTPLTFDLLAISLMALFYFIYLFYPSNASVSKAAEDNLREEGIKEERAQRGEKAQ